MYCSSCGSALATGLSYCNRCGAELSAKKSGSGIGPQLPESLVWAIVGVSVGGLALIIGLMAVMKHELQFDPQLIVLFSLLSFLLLLLAEIVFTWLLVGTVRRSRNREQNPDVLSHIKASTTKELGEARERFLNEPAISVTEETTRALEAAHRESKPQ